MKYGIPMVAALASMVSATAVAQELSYTNISLGYHTGEAIDIDITGFGIAGNAALNDRVFLTGTYSILESDDGVDIGFGADEVELNQFSAGVGFHAPLGPRTDFVGTLRYADSEVEYLGSTVDGDGYTVAAGVRSLRVERVEVGASVNYADIEEESDTGYAVTGRYFIVPRTSLGLTYSSGDDSDLLTFDVRVDL